MTNWREAPDSSPESPDEDISEGISDDEFRARWGMGSLPVEALEPPFFDFYGTQRKTN